MGGRAKISARSRREIQGVRIRTEFQPFSVIGVAPAFFVQNDVPGNQAALVVIPIREAVQIRREESRNRMANHERAEIFALPPISPFRKCASWLLDSDSWLLVPSP